MLRLGVIGLGRMGTYHARCALQAKHIALTHLVDTTIPKVLPVTKNSLTVTSDHTDLFGQVDAVIIATPTPTHFALAKDFLQAGIHVLVEKPITPTLAEAQTLFALAKKHGCALHIGHVERYNDAMRAARDHVTTPRLINAIRTSPYHPRVAHDSVALDLMIHDVDSILLLMQSPVTSITAAGTSLLSATTDSATVLLTFANGGIAQLTAYRNAPKGQRMTTIEQDGATIELNFATQTTRIIAAESEAVHEKREGHNPLLCEIEAFAHAIINSENMRNPEHDLAVIATTRAICDQIEAALLPQQDIRTHEAAH